MKLGRITEQTSLIVEKRSALAETSLYRSFNFFQGIFGQNI